MIDQDTLFFKKTLNNEFATTKSIQLLINNIVLSASWEGITNEDDESLNKTPSTDLNTPTIVEGQIIAIQKESMDEMFYFNDNSETKFSGKTYVYAKSSNKWQFLNVKNIKQNDVLLKYEDGAFIEYIVNSINIGNEPKIGYKIFHTSPTIIAGGFVICSKVDDNYFQIWYTNIK